MNSSRTMIAIVGILFRSVLWMPYVHVTEIKHVLFGSTVTLSCNISYLYHTTWLKHNPDHVPTVLVCASLKDGQPFKDFQLSPHFSVALLNRSLALRITAVKERDLGLYYCIAFVNTHITIGRGTLLQGTALQTPPSLVTTPYAKKENISSSESVWFIFHDWYLMAVGFGLLILIMAICITHWKSNNSNNTAPAH